MAYNIKNLSGEGSKGFRVIYSFNAQALNNDAKAFNAFWRALYGDLGGRHKRRLERYFNAIMASHFSLQQSRAGGRWAELRKATQDSREAIGAGGAEPKLVVTGRLYDAATHVAIKTTRGANKTIFIEPNNGGPLRKRLQAQFAVHNQPTSHKTTIAGTAFGTVSIPGREFFYLRQEYVEPIAELVVTDAMDALRKTAHRDSFIQFSRQMLKESSVPLTRAIRSQRRRILRRSGKL